jgi:chromosomal replication initiator protein
VPDEILTYIARRIPSNIRELEGALIRVLAHARLVKTSLTLDMAQSVLDSILAHASDLTPDKIVSTVAGYYKLSKEDLVGRSRARSVSRPRQLTMYIIREETNTSLPQIGKLLGGRDHTTVMHGCETIGAQIETNEQLRRDWLAIKQLLADDEQAR